MAQKEGAVTGITVEVEELQRKNRDSFQIPEWFLYTSRAFLTLEGVSLQADESFSIVKSCFPYVAKRLVGDDSPRVQKYVTPVLCFVVTVTLIFSKLTALFFTLLLLF